MSRTACSNAGQFFAWSGVSSSPALSAAMRASVNAAMSSALAMVTFDARTAIAKTVRSAETLLRIDKMMSRRWQALPSRRSRA